MGQGYAAVASLSLVHLIAPSVRCPRTQEMGGFLIYPPTPRLKPQTVYYLWTGFLAFGFAMIFTLLPVYYILVGIAGSAALARWGLQAPILTGALIIFATGVFLIIAMRETSFVPAARTERNSWKATLDTPHDGMRTTRRSPFLVTFVLIALFAGMSGEGYDRLWEAHLLENIPFPALLDLQSTTWIGIIAGLSSVLSIVVTETVHRRLDQSHPRSVTLVLVFCTAAQVAGVLGFAWSGQFFLAVVCHLVASLCKGIAAPLRNSWLVRSVDPQVRATPRDPPLTGDTPSTGGPVGPWLLEAAAASLLTDRVMPCRRNRRGCCFFR